jgi:hypothetical protein
MKPSLNWRLGLEAKRLRLLERKEETPVIKEAAKPLILGLGRCSKTRYVIDRTLQCEKKPGHIGSCHYYYRIPEKPKE